MTVGSPLLSEDDLIVSVDEVAVLLQTTFSVPAYKQVLMQLKMLQGTLERHLNRPVTVRQFKQTLRVDDYGDVNLRWGPIHSIDEVSLNGVPGTPATYFDETFQLTYSLPYGSKLDVTYTAGGCDELSEDVRGCILMSIARWQVQGLQVATGAVQNMSVEGMSVQYTLRGAGSRAANGKGGLGFTADELDSVSRLRRRVLVR